jgi:hexosaminidase
VCDGSLTPRAGEVDESYTLFIPSGSCEGRITANSSLGVLWALQSLNQLFYTHTSGDIYSPHAPISIRDEPAFAHRGLNMDLSRHYFPKDALLRVIECLSWQKFNRLHLHITDSQSWPLEVPSLPELAFFGAYSPHLSYSAEDLDEILGYAANRGVQAYLEIDLPGHTQSIAYSHPELIVAANIQPNWYDYANQPPSGQLKLNNTHVTKFVRRVLRDVLPRTGCASEYFHSGGDEINANVYALDPGVKSNDSKVIQPYLQKFVSYCFRGR